MATKKSTIVIISVLALVVGYVVGGIFGIPPTDSSLLSGDIGKVTKHKSNVVNESEALIEQKLRTDTVFMAQTTYTLAFVSSRITEFKENAALTSEIVAEYPQMQQYQQSMSDLATVGTNAEVSAAAALEALNKISLGQEGSSYEEFSNNAILSYMLLEKGMTVSADFVKDVDEFLKGKALNDYQQLAFVRDMWANYNLVTAIVNQDNTLIDYWIKAGNKLTVDQTKLGIWNSSTSFQNNIAIASNFNAQILGSASSKLNLVNAVSRIQGINSLNMKGQIWINAQSSINLNGQIYQAVKINNDGKLAIFANEAIDAQSKLSLCMFPADLHANVAIAVSASLESIAISNLGQSDNPATKGHSAQLSLSSNQLGASINGAINAQNILGVSANQSLMLMQSSNIK